MDREQMRKINIDDILYNKKTAQVVVMTSAYSNDKGEIKDIDSLSSDNVLTEQYVSISPKDIDDWEFFSYEAPANIMCKVIMAKLNGLEQFVYSRLR